MSDRGPRSPILVQRRVGAAAAAAAFLIALAEVISAWARERGFSVDLLVLREVWMPLFFAVVMFVAAVREGRFFRVVQIGVFLAAGLGESAFSPQGEMTGMILYVFGIVLGIQYDLIPVRGWPRILALLSGYGAVEVLLSIFVFRDSPLIVFPTVVATALFFYLFWLVFAREIQERRHSEALLRESEERFEITVRNSEIMTAHQNRELRYAWYYNPHPWLEGIELSGKRDADLYPPEDAARLEKLKRSVLERGVGLKQEFSTRIDGRERYLDLAIDPLYDAEGRVTGVSVASKDVTERIVMREQLIQSERYIAAGQLATYIAHEINSPLQGITSLLAVIKNLHPDDEELSTNLQLVAGAFSSIRDTVRKLLNLNRPFSEQREVVDLNEVIATTLSLTGGLLREEGVRTSLALAPGTLEIRGYAQQITQVFINLINNAIEAMNRTQDTTAQLEPPDATNGRRERRVIRMITVSTAREAREAVVRFLDSGPGFTREERTHLFDPFFTRKSRIGMGIGLSITLQIIEGLGGSITAENAEVGGALFTIRLPLITGTARPTSFAPVP